MEEDNEQYEYEDYDEDDEVEGDEVEGSEAEEEEEEEEYEDLVPTREEQEFLKLRERLKEEIRQKMKKETDNHSSQSQDKNGSAANDKFGSFFGPSKPVIATRVLAESRSIRETQHIVAKQNKSGPALTATGTKTCADPQQQNVKELPKVVDKVKALKEKRDYSFLLSDDPDLPDPIKEEPAPQKTPVQNSGNAFRPASGNPQHLSQKASGQKSASKPAKLVGNGLQKSSASASRHVQSKIGSKEPPLSRSKPAPAGARKGIESNGNGSGQPQRRVALPQKVHARGTGPTNIASTSGTQKPLSAKLDSSKRLVAQGQDKLKATQKQLMPSSRIQPKPSSARNNHGERPKKRPVVSDEYEDCISEIRNMFGFVFVILLSCAVNIVSVLVWFKSVLNIEFKYQYGITLGLDVKIVFLTLRGLAGIAVRPVPHPFIVLYMCVDNFELSVQLLFFVLPLIFLDLYIFSCIK